MKPAAALSPRSSLWALRVICVALAATMGLAIGDAAEGRTAVAANVAAVAWWLTVAGLVIALVVPSALGLTLVRLLLPATVPAAVIALLLGASPTIAAPTLALSFSGSIVAFSSECGEALVQGSAYGHERRFPLRAPAALLLPMCVSWIVWCALVLGAVLLLCAQQWFAGALVAVVAGAVSWLLARRFHVLSRRWLVLVPAGVVLHDQLVLGETLMVQRPNVALARLALAETQAADLTGPAAGHALEITMRAMELATLAGTRANPKGKALHVQSVLVAPSRPGRALRAMAEAKLPVG